MIMRLRVVVGSDSAVKDYVGVFMLVIIETS